MKNMKKIVISVMLIMALLSIITGSALEKPRVALLKGPTGMGAAHMMVENKENYEFALHGAPDELVGAIVSGSVDIAAVPTNLASVLYNKTKGNVNILALNTLGVLYVLERGDSVQSVADLAGKTVVTSGQGATPDYVLSYILDKQNVEGCTVDFKSEHSEVTSLAVSKKADLVLLPEPHVSVLLSKSDDFRVALDLTEEFAKAAEKDQKADTVLSMGCYIVRKEFLDNNKEAVLQFMQDAEKSVQFVQENPELAAQEMADLGILANKNVALSAIPKCNIVFIQGEDMKKQVQPLFQILFDLNKKSVGNALPQEDFYFVK